MTATHTTDPCACEACLVPPAEFVRLRYFFGQHLGVVDLADEQSYFVGKQRFHNLRAHGVGVLCGLLAERYVFPQGSPPTTPTTLLRVRRGAALDGCGREIIVGWDQCIDVAAWFAQHPDVAANAERDNFTLWVALKYRECPSDPASAPRDPCGCEAGGCEFARIREGFELMLLTSDEAVSCIPGDNWPPGADLVPEELLGDPLDIAYARLVALRAAAGCPDPPANPCLLLASFRVTLDSTGKKVVGISAPDNAIPERRTLVPTSVLQRTLSRALVTAGESGLLAGGPHFGGVLFVNGGSNSGKLSIGIVTAGSDLSGNPLSPPAQLTVSASRFNDAGAWETTPSFTTTYNAGPPPQIDIAWASGGLVNGGRYRVVIVSDRVQPPVDKKMRPLTPPVWARHFRLVADSSGKLVLAETLFT
jgi:hypothetical protein